MKILGMKNEMKGSSERLPSTGYSGYSKTPLDFIEKGNDMILPVLQKEKNIYIEMIHAYAPSLSSCLSGSSYITTRSSLYLPVYLLRTYLPEDLRTIQLTLE